MFRLIFIMFMVTACSNKIEKFVHICKYDGDCLIKKVNRCYIGENGRRLRYTIENKTIVTTCFDKSCECIYEKVK